MKKFITHWKRGWKTLLMIVCINFAYSALLIPIFVIAAFFYIGKIAYWSYCAMVGIIFVPAITHYIFELFYGAGKQPVE